MNTFLMLAFLIFIEVIITWPIINFISNAKTILLPLEQKNPTISLLQYLFSEIATASTSNNTKIN